MRNVLQQRGQASAPQACVQAPKAHVQLKAGHVARGSKARSGPAHTAAFATSAGSFMIRRSTTQSHTATYAIFAFGSSALYGTVRM